MSSRRVERVNHTMREEIANLLLREVKDPRIALVNVTAVDVSPDLRHAQVYFSCLGGEEQRAAAQVGLDRASGFLRAQLSKRLQLRHTPDLRFVADSSAERGEHLVNLLRQVAPPSDS